MIEEKARRRIALGIWHTLDAKFDPLASPINIRALNAIVDRVCWQIEQEDKHERERPDPSDP